MTGGETASFAPTLIIIVYRAFGEIKDLFIFVKVGARSPRPERICTYNHLILMLHSS